MVGVRTALGLTDLLVPPSLARDLVRGLCVALGDAAPAAVLAPQEVRPGYLAARRDGRQLKAETRVTYLRAWADWQARRSRNLSAACRLHGVSYSAAQRWLAENRDRLAAECHAAGIPFPAQRHAT